MLKAYLFDRRRGAKVDDWAESLRGLGKEEMLWVDLTTPAAAEAAEVDAAFDLDSASILLDGERKAALDQQDGYLVVTAVAVSDAEDDVDRERVVLTCFVGPNWLVTMHEGEIAVIDDFHQVASGAGGVGALDAPSFLAALLEWVVSSYVRAFDEIETKLEDFDVEALTTASTDPDVQIGLLIDARRRVGALRRSLAPHREVFGALSHSEFDPLSSEASGRRFAELIARLDSALVTAGNVKESIASSFDILIVRTEHRTSEIVKVLTLVSILLLPGALLTGIAGMNVNFKPEVFADSTLFWLVIASVIAVAGGSLLFVRVRHWI